MRGECGRSDETDRPNKGKHGGVNRPTKDLPVSISIKEERTVRFRFSLRIEVVGRP
jgi:hypothetical protein